MSFHGLYVGLILQNMNCLRYLDKINGEEKKNILKGNSLVRNKKKQFLSIKTVCMFAVKSPNISVDM